MNILITGCTGDLGSKLVDHFTSQGHQVIGVARSPPKTNVEKKNFKFITTDLGTDDLVTKVQDAQIDLVIHLAAVIPGKMPNKDIEAKAMFDTNVLGTMNVLEMMKRKRIKQLIFASSMAVYGRPSSLPVRENHPQVPVTLYGLTKKYAEELIINSCESEGFTACIFRFPGFFGPHRKNGAVYNFCSSAIANREIVINPKSALPWDVLHISDVASAVLNCSGKIMELRGANIFNLDYGVPVNLVKVAKLIIRLSNSKSPIVVENPEKIQDFYYDAGKATKILNWRAPKLETRLKEYLSEIQGGPS